MTESDERPAGEDSAATGFVTSTAEVLRIALPLMISTGMFSLVLFVDRTLLLKFDGQSMGAAMAGGNLFWVLICLPVGLVSMTGAIISQYVGAGQESNVGRFLWQAFWFSLALAPLFAIAGYFTPQILRVTGQPESLVGPETVYVRWLLVGAVGNVLETALAGFFSGVHRTAVIMYVSVVSGVLNLALDVVLIFGVDESGFLGIGVPALGIAGAAIASSVAFWFKAFCYIGLLMRRSDRVRYGLLRGFGIDGAMIGKLMFFGFPAGLAYLTESGGFTVIVLRIGSLGDVPLRATTMAINFNMVAFIPLIGVSIAASVLVGRHLVETGPTAAIRSVGGAMLIGLIYSMIWVLAYTLTPDTLMSLYEAMATDADSTQAIALAQGLLGFVALYVVFDAVQLILAGALRGAGDTWFVLLGGLVVIVIAIATGMLFEPNPVGSDPVAGLRWWWWILTGWILSLALLMTARFAQGKWKRMRMV